MILQLIFTCVLRREREKRYARECKQNCNKIRWLPRMLNKVVELASKHFPRNEIMSELCQKNQAFATRTCCSLPSGTKRKEIMLQNTSGIKRVYMHSDKWKLKLFCCWFWRFSNPPELFLQIENMARGALISRTGFEKFGWFLSCLKKRILRWFLKLIFVVCLVGLGGFLRVLWFREILSKSILVGWIFLKSQSPESTMLILVNSWFCGHLQSPLSPL